MELVDILIAIYYVAVTIGCGYIFNKIRKES